MQHFYNIFEPRTFTCLADVSQLRSRIRELQESREQTRALSPAFGGGLGVRRTRTSMSSLLFKRAVEIYIFVFFFGLLKLSIVETERKDFKEGKKSIENARFRAPTISSRSILFAKRSLLDA